MKDVRIVVAVLSLCSGVAVAATDPQAPSGGGTPGEGKAAAGSRMYRDGLLPSGQPVRAALQGGVALAGAQAACVNCHRRSGLGAAEGRTVVPPVTGSALFRPRWEGAPQLAYLNRGAASARRPAYTAESLARAIREGIDPTGRTLDSPMPRYALSDAELAPLIAYLKSLSASPAPGVTADAIHFATVVGEGVGPGTRKAMLDVLKAFFRDKNAGTRNEVGRAQRAPWDMAREYGAYRRWELHLWELRGPAATWPAQLEAHYRRQPVFALVSGMVAGPWRPVHEFCETREVPCLFPNTDLPEVDGEGFYSLYFSRGVTLEAEALARHLQDRGATARAGPVVQVFGGDAAAVAAQALRTALPGAGTRDRLVGETERLAAAFWKDLLQRDRPPTLVLWLRDPDLAGLDAALAGATPEVGEIYLSASLAGEYPPSVPDGLRDRLYLVHPFDLPQARDRKLLRMKAWLRARGVESGEERVQANTYFAATAAADALMRMADNFSREYFIERVESMVDDALTTSLYPRVSLGPGQRFVSRGAYVLGFSGDGPSPVGGWIVP